MGILLSTTGLPLLTASGLVALSTVGAPPPGEELELETSDGEGFGLRTAVPMTVFWTIDDTPTAESAAAIEAASDADADGYLASNETAPNSEPQNMAMATPGNHYIHFVGKRASDSGYTNIVNHPITVPPTLTNVGLNSIGKTTVNVTVETNFAGGKLFVAAFPADADPDLAEIKAGTGADYAGSVVNPGLGAEAFAATELTAGQTYRAHLVHNTDADGASGADSAVVTSIEFQALSAGVQLIGSPILMSISHTDGDQNLELEALGVDLQEGDAVVSLAAADNFGSSGGVQISTPGYSNIFAPAFPLVGDFKIMGAEPDTILTLPGTGSGWSRHRATIIFALRGVDPDTPFDGTPTSATGSSSPIDAASLTTTSALSKRIIVGGATNGNTTGFAAPSGFSGMIERGTLTGGDAGAAIVCAFRDEATPGALDPAAFGGGPASGHGWCAMHLAFRARFTS